MPFLVGSIQAVSVPDELVSKPRPVNEEVMVVLPYDEQILRQLAHLRQYTAARSRASALLPTKMRRQNPRRKREASCPDESCTSTRHENRLARRPQRKVALPQCCACAWSELRRHDDEEMRGAGPLRHRFAALPT